MIELNSKNLSRFTKRLKKSLQEQLSIDIKLTKSAQIFSEIFGAKDIKELTMYLEKEVINENTVYRGEFSKQNDLISNVNNIAVKNSRNRSIDEETFNEIQKIYITQQQERHLQSKVSTHLETYKYVNSKFLSYCESNNLYKIRQLMTHQNGVYQEFLDPNSYYEKNLWKDNRISMFMHHLESMSIETIRYLLTGKYVENNILKQDNVSIFTEALKKTDASSYFDEKSKYNYNPFTNTYLFEFTSSIDKIEYLISGIYKGKKDHLPFTYDFNPNNSMLARICLIWPNDTDKIKILINQYGLFFPDVKEYKFFILKEMVPFLFREIDGKSIMFDNLFHIMCSITYKQKQLFNDLEIKEAIKDHYKNTKFLEIYKDFFKSQKINLINT